MPKIVAHSKEAASVDAALADWAQGDLTLGDLVFVHAADPRQTLTTEIVTEEDAELVTIESEVIGVVVVSQTCDIVRSCVERPFVEVSPLVELDSDARVDEVRKGLRPRYLFVPAVAEQRLVGDLDRTMTVEKPVVAAWTRTKGCDTDSQRHSLAQALARQRARTAFPDDFTKLVARLTSRIKDKHRKDSDEGRVLSAIREIRVAASPQWDAPAVTLMFWFVLEEPEGLGKALSHEQIQGQIEKWLALVPVGGRFPVIHGMATDLMQMTAADYVSSDLLDLDHLSP